MSSVRWLLTLVFCQTLLGDDCGAVASAAPPSAPFELRDGDRVALIGATFLEREQRRGYLETALASHFAGRRFIVRNLAWSGDTVFGDARSYFDKAEGGFQRLTGHLDDLQPTVAFVSYGWVESWEGPAGLEAFDKGLRRLLDLVGRHASRIVLITPPRSQPSTAPLPDATERNAALDLYGKRLLDIASERGCYTLDLFAALDPQRAGVSAPLTDNGVHFTDYGYWRIAPLAMQALGLEPDPSRQRIERRAPLGQSGGFSFVVARAELPAPLAPQDAPAEAAREAPPLVVAAPGLAPGSYSLKVDGVEVATGAAEEWSRGIALRHDPDAAQTEALRKAIVKKNEFFFHRFRPANETYIFGFRKREQGQNAAEMPQFDPLVEEQEQRIVELSAPRSHEYELVPAAPRPR